MKTLFLIYAFAIGFAIRPSAVADTIISPFAVGNGNSAAADPIWFSVRYQQVFQASDFLSAMPQGGLISKLAFKVEPGLPFGATESSIRSIRFDFSTTQKSVNNLSLVFAENVGPDNTTVFGPSGTFVSGAGGQFDFVFQFATPYMYDPRVGNLLMDVRNPFGGSVQEFHGIGIDAVQGGASSRIANPDVNATTANLFDSTGAVTQFTFTPVPEPSPLQIGLSAALAGLAIFVFKRCKGAKIS